MGMAGSAPKVETQPPIVTYEDVRSDQDVQSRGDARKRLAGAVNSSSAILTPADHGSGKRLLGQ